ncbi:MAG: hypothetical protein KDA74_03940, partial [Planctomycetaceae bacterium]|nr:hypothetical protein [Planctomycetaceae bacterium]
PTHAETIRSYDQLRFFARKFGQGLYNCLICVGPPGRLKSSIIEAEAGKDAHLISGHSTPFEVFCEAQENKDRLLIIDDADGLYREASGQRLLKNLTNPRMPKSVHWTSDAPTKRGLAKRFETKSNVCIIDNAWNANNEHIAALEDRSRLFLFDPPPVEVHREMDEQDWFYNEEIYSFVGANLCLLPELSARAYVKAAEAKEAGENWREYLLRSYVNPADLQMVLIEYEDEWRGLTVEEKCKEWCRRTGRCRATYFNRKRSLLADLQDRAAGAEVPMHPLVGRWSLGM